MKAVILDAESLGSDVDLSPLSQPVDHLEIHPMTTPDQVVERIQGCNIVIVNKVILGLEEMRSNPDLRLIAVTATGTNNIDLAAARERGIVVRNVTAYGTPTLVQHTFSLILALSNRLLDYVADVRDGHWSRSRTFCLMSHPIRELAGKKLGVVGYGEIGRAVARMGEAFGMEVLVAARPGQPPREGRVPWEEVLSQADVLSLHCLLNEQTRHLIGERELARMKRDAILINTARGGLVDELALADALRAGRLGGAGLDVLSQEPPPADHPLLAPDLPNLIVTPHCAWASREARQRLIDKTGANIRDFIQGTRG